jgi:hypothetical protein
VPPSEVKDNAAFHQLLAQQCRHGSVLDMQDGPWRLLLPIHLRPGHEDGYIVGRVESVRPGLLVAMNPSRRPAGVGDDES